MWETAGSIKVLFNRSLVWKHYFCKGEYDMCCLVHTTRQVAPAEGFSDLAMQVMTSPSKNYILTMIGAGVAVLFLMGLLCGRFTKRVTQELKDR